MIAPLVLSKLAVQEKDTLEKLVNAIVPTVPPPDRLIAEARMNAEARRAVLEGSEWLTAARLSEIAGFKGRNASAQPNKWKREAKIFALRHNGIDLYPSYALGSDHRPIKGLDEILRAFEGKADAWAIAIWFASMNSFLGGVAPKDLLKENSEAVLAAARDELDGVLHG